jgi:hypothetical protein
LNKNTLGPLGALHMQSLRGPSHAQPEGAEGLEREEMINYFNALSYNPDGPRFLLALTILFAQKPLVLYHCQL